NIRDSTMYTLSLHDALPICKAELNAMSSMSVSKQISNVGIRAWPQDWKRKVKNMAGNKYTWSVKKMNWKEYVLISKNPLIKWSIDRKSTRLNSSHVSISYAV